jgi:hypothetical protein
VLGEAGILGKPTDRRRRDRQASLFQYLGEDLTEHRVPHFWVLHFFLLSSKVAEMLTS